MRASTAALYMAYCRGAIVQRHCPTDWGQILMDVLLSEVQMAVVAEIEVW